MENILVEGLESFLDQSVNLDQVNYIKPPVISLYAVKPREEVM